MKDTAVVQAVVSEVGKRVVGQTCIIERPLIGLLTKTSVDPLIKFLHNRETRGH